MISEIIAAVIAGIFQVIAAMIRRCDNVAKKEEGRSHKRPSSRRK